MKPRDAFDILARTVGLILALYGGGYLLYGLLATLELLETSSARSNAVFGIVQVAVGLLIMRGVIPVADIAFPPDHPPPPAEVTCESRQKGQDERTPG